mmetsp:Transcript_28724/g.43385  ORF Transcript_28724/g.43385 Transcript_28724/m.43385 type:complete len:86 (+) Transcript_28724:1840-2097(+)
MWNEEQSSSRSEPKKQVSPDNDEENVSDIIVTKVSVLEETLEKKLEYIDYHLEFEQVKSFSGKPMTMEDFFQVVFVFGSILFTFL